MKMNDTVTLDSFHYYTILGGLCARNKSSNKMGIVKQNMRLSVRVRVNYSLYIELQRQGTKRSNIWQRKK